VRRTLGVWVGLALALCLLSGCTTGKLSEKELADFEKALHTESNYGFLLSSYDDPTGIDLSQLLYVGAGMERPENAPDIVAAHEATLVDGAPDCGSTILTTAQIDGFLMAKTGRPFTDMKKSLEWDYVEQYDAYIHYHGDTNFVKATCTAGTRVEKDRYEINYEIPGGIFDDKGNVLKQGTVIVKTAGAGSEMQFVSNKLR